MSDLAMSEIRVCPDCQLEAVRRPELDTATQIAFRCPSHWHRTLFEDAPKEAPKIAHHRAAVKAPVVADTLPVTDAPKGTV